MTRLLFAFLLLPFCGYAQLEVGVNASLVPYAVSKEGAAELKVGQGIAATVGYKLHKIKAGLGYSAAVLPVRQQYSDGLMPIGYATLYYAKPLSAIYVFADREWQFNRFYFYLGADMGGAFLRGSNYFEYTPGPLTASGLAVGVHAGCSYDFYKGLCANVQVGITDAIMAATKDEGSLTVTTFPVSVGLHYKLHWHQHKAAAAVK